MIQTMREWARDMAQRSPMLGAALLLAADPEQELQGLGEEGEDKDRRPEEDPHEEEEVSRPRHGRVGAAPEEVLGKRFGEQENDRGEEEGDEELVADPLRRHAAQGVRPPGEDLEGQVVPDEDRHQDGGLVAQQVAQPTCNRQVSEFESPLGLSAFFC